MTPLVFFGLIVAASAAPQFFDPFEHPHFNQHRHLSPYIEDNLFKTENFWNQLEQELQELDKILAEFSKQFPSSASREGVEGNEYKITIPLAGYVENEIVVKARDGMLMVQAVHKTDDGTNKSYLDIRGLPTCVNVRGSWTYENGVLKIVFPLKQGSEQPTEETTEVFTTEGYKQEESREEMEPNRGPNNADADVGLERGDSVQTLNFNNEIPRNTVEATTYAVDLKGEVEFVPVRY